MAERLYFRQLLSGRDFASSNELAHQMVNFAYLIGDKESGEALAVDPAYDPSGIAALARTEGFELTGVLLTHYHADHAGGDLFGHAIAGIAELLEEVPLPVHVQRDEAVWIERSTGVDRSSLVEHGPGDVVEVGGIGITLVHTPGHTPGSHCFLVDGKLVAGDTLFLNGCGRTDLPGSDPAQMYDSLQNRLAKLPGGTVVYPGHLYSEEPYGELDELKHYNPVLAPRRPEEWLALFGG